MVMCAEAIFLILQREFISNSRQGSRVNINELLKVMLYFNCLLGEEIQLSRWRERFPKL